MDFQKVVLSTITLIVILAGCSEITEQDKFQRPEWIPGKLYTTLKVQDNLSMFAECLEITGFDTIVDISGSYAIFAPNDSAMQAYLDQNGFASIPDIPREELMRLTKYHIVQNPWSYKQLSNLGGNGWRSSHYKDPYSYAFKRETILKNANAKVWVKRDGSRYMIVSDSTQTNRYRRAYVQSRKYVPVFYDAYLDINGITPQDYTFYFGREYEREQVYFAGAKIIEADIFAENGFVHVIDKVVPPMLNAKEMLERDLPDQSYQLMLDMVNWYYPEFEPNIPATYDQPSVMMGGIIDTLWNLSYEALAFDLNSELVGEIKSANNTVVYHNGMVVPTDKAFRDFIDNVLTVNSGYPHWRDLYSLPRDISDIIVNPLFRSTPVYPSSQSYTDLFFEENGFVQNETDIVRREFGSNASFIGINSYSPDRLFTSITGPVYLRPAFSLFRRAIQYSGTQHSIANTEGNLCFFVISDNALRSDSSLILNWIDQADNWFNFTELNRITQRISYLSPGNTANRILNHVGLSLPNGSADKEFIQTLGGIYIVWNNVDNSVQGNIPSTVGFNGVEEVTCLPELLPEPADNGRTYSINNWLNFESKSMFIVIRRYGEFFRLIRKAGLFDEDNLTFPFLEDEGNYTVFIPSDQAWDDIEADTLSNEMLGELLKKHFVANALIFTDNKQPSGVYSTVNDSVLNINTVPDGLEILSDDGELFHSIEEQEEQTNIMIFSGNRVTSVAHETDRVLYVE